MSAKGVLVNPLLMATDFINQFDRQQTPECTEGREGYIWFNGIQAGQNEAVLKANIRDFDKDNFASRKQQIADVTARIAARYPTAKVDYRIEETYSNISNAIGEDRRAIDLMFAAMESLGITPKPTPMRGGTDGAALSAKVVSPRTSSPARITSIRSLNSCRCRRSRRLTTLPCNSACWPRVKQACAPAS